MNRFLSFTCLKKFGMNTLNYIEESTEYGILWPKYDEIGRFTNTFFLLLPFPFVLGYVSYKRRGLKYFVEKNILSRSKARRFIKVHGKHNLWDNMSVDEGIGLKNTYKKRNAKVWVRSTSGHDQQYYKIGLNNMPDRFDDKKSIITSLSRLDIRHIGRVCGMVESTHEYILPQKLVKRWLRDREIPNLKIHFLCSHQIDACLKLANNPYLAYAMDFYGVLKEENLEESICSQLRWINEGIFKMQTLNRLAFPELFEETKLMKLVYEDLYGFLD